MDYIKLIIILFTNFAIIIFLILAIMIKFDKERKMLKKSKSITETDLNAEVVIGLIMFIIWVFIFTIPVFRDIPYLLTQNYAEVNGKIMRCDEKSIVAAITNANQETKYIEISGEYDLEPDTTIVLEYLPHMDLRVGWYILDPETLEKEKPESNKIALIDNEAFLLALGLGIPAVASFVFIIFVNKIKNMPVNIKKMFSYIMMAVGLVSLLSIIRLSQL